jgi:hypothetical protein
MGVWELCLVSYDCQGDINDLPLSTHTCAHRHHTGLTFPNCLARYIIVSFLAHDHSAFEPSLSRQKVDTSGICNDASKSMSLRIPYEIPRDCDRGGCELILREHGGSARRKLRRHQNQVKLRLASRFDTYMGTANEESFGICTRCWNNGLPLCGYGQDAIVLELGVRMVTDVDILEAYTPRSEVIWAAHHDGCLLET